MRRLGHGLGWHVDLWEREAAWLLFAVELRRGQRDLAGLSKEACRLGRWWGEGSGGNGREVGDMGDALRNFADVVGGDGKEEWDEDRRWSLFMTELESARAFGVPPRIAR